MLLEDDRGGERRFQAVRGPGADDAAERPQRLAALFLVVGQIVQPALDGGWRTQARDHAPLGCRQRQARRLDRLSARERESL